MEVGPEVELVLVVDGVGQFPNRVLLAGWAAGSVVVVVLVDDVIPAEMLAKPVKSDGAAVLLLSNPPNIEDVLVEEGLVAELVAVRHGGCWEPKLVPAVLLGVLPKMGLKVGTAGLFSSPDVDEEVVVATKIGLNPDTGRELVLPANSVLLAGGTVAAAGLPAEETAGVLRLLASPNRPAPATVALGALVAWPSTWVKAEDWSTPVELD